MRHKQTLRKKRRSRKNQKRLQRSRKINQKRLRRTRKINQKGGGRKSIAVINAKTNIQIGDAKPHQQYAYHKFMEKKKEMPELESMHFVIKMKINDRPKQPFDFFIEKDQENPDSAILILTTNPMESTPPIKYKLLPSMLNTQPKIFAEKIVKNSTGTHSEFDDALLYQQYAYDYFTVRKVQFVRLRKIEFEIIITTPDSEVETHLFTITNNEYEDGRTFASELWDNNFLKLTEGTVVHFLSKDEDVLRGFIATKNRVSSDLW